MKQDGNVIHHDFRPKYITLDLNLKTDILYHDDAVALSRVTFTHDGKPFSAMHVLCDLATGDTVTL